MRFTLRDLFWLTLVVGLAVGWALDRSRLATECREASENATYWMKRFDFLDASIDRAGWLVNERGRLIPYPPSD